MLEATIRTYRETGEPIRWPVAPDLVRSPAVAFRNNAAAELTRKSVPQIANLSAYMSVASVERLVRLALREIKPDTFQGVGLELGAGCGLLSSFFARHPAVKAVFALEVCENLAACVIPKVASYVLGPESRKVVPVFGSWDCLQVPDQSVDFVVEFRSLHHADDLAGALAECARVLKPGGWMLCIDRAHPDTVTEQQVEKMLAQVYSRSFLLGSGYPPDIVLTRRENGEHEYRLFEWRRAFKRAGLELVKLRKLLWRVPVRKALKGCLSVLPRSITRRIYLTEDATLGTTIRWFTQWAAAVRQIPEFGRPLLAPTKTEETLFLLHRNEVCGEAERPR